MSTAASVRFYLHSHILDTPKVFVFPGLMFSPTSVLLLRYDPKGCYSNLYYDLITHDVRILSEQK